jgi:hypothetical protein
MQVTSLLAVGAAVLGTACGMADPCGNVVVQQASSPSGRWDAFVFERDCGATTTWSTQVAVLPGGSPFQEQPTWWASTISGNVATVADRAERPGVEGTRMAVRWTGDTHFTVEYEAGATLRTAERLVAGVAVTYRPVEH